MNLGSPVTDTGPSPSMGRGEMPYVEVWVDSGDLEDFDDDALLEECMKRNLIPACYVTDSDQAAHLNRIFEAIKLGRDADALQLTRTYVQDVTGRVLP